MKMILAKLGLVLLAANIASLCALVVEKYGCKFANNKFDLSPQQEDVYGDLIDPIFLDDEPALAMLVGEIKRCYADFFLSLNYNTIEDYVGLFEKYNESVHGNDFASFFTAHKPTLEPRVNSVGLLIKLLDDISVRLKPIYGDISKNMFIAGSQEDVRMSVPDFQTLNENFLTTTEGKKTTHVMGVVKFMMGPRLGHILFDSGYAIPSRPVIIMHDGQPVQEFPNFPPNAINIIYNPVRHGLTFTVHPTNPFFIIAKSGPIEPNRTRIDHLTYLGYPFCPFISVTKKFELLKFDRYLLYRNADGTPEAGIFFYNLYCLNSMYALIARMSYKDRFTAFFVNETTHSKEIQYIEFSKFDYRSAGSPVLAPREERILQSIASKITIELPRIWTMLRKVNKLMSNQKYLKLINSYAMMQKKQSVELYIKPKGIRRTPTTKYQ